MNDLGSVPMAKNVIPKGLAVKMSCQRTYKHEKATARAVAFVDVLSYFQCSELGRVNWQDFAWIPDLGICHAGRGACEAFCGIRFRGSLTSELADPMLKHNKEGDDKA
jgi:hypothetical protein